MLETMSLKLDARALRDLLADPAAAEVLSAATGTPLVIIEVGDAAAGRELAGLDITLVPAVVLAVAADPRYLPPAAFPAADVILTEDAAAGAPFVGPADGVAAAIEQISATLDENPVAGTALALLMRSSAGLPVPEALIAESATYSALQEGTEFRRWRSGRPSPAPSGCWSSGLAASCGSRCPARPAATRSTGGCATRWPVRWPSRPPIGGWRSCCAAPGLTSARAATWTSSAPGPTRRSPT